MILDGRDAVLWYSQKLTLRDNVLTGGDMGCTSCTATRLIEGNRLIGNSVGGFLMYSRRLHMRHNDVSSNRPERLRTRPQGRG